MALSFAAEHAEAMTTIRTFATGECRDAVLKEKTTVKTPFGDLTPRYKRESSRDKYAKSISFYKSGAIKSIVPQTQTTLETPVGKLPAELVTFHENGMLHRVFPLNGQINGFWTESDEASLAEMFTFDLDITSFKAKIMSVQFYDGGALKGITLWPGEIITLKTPQGPATCRIGFTLHPDGALKSFEPASPFVIESSIGAVTAYDYNALGIHSDHNAVEFSQDGNIKRFATPLTTIIVEDAEGKHRFAPKTMLNPLDNESLMIVSNTVIFEPHQVMVNGVSYDPAHCTISTHTLSVIGGLQMGLVTDIAM